jgi:ElaB/YqjD/DUF883 family membrane-anchored ribosome-binding protein
MTERMSAATATWDGMDSREPREEKAVPRTLRSDVDRLRSRVASATDGALRLLDEAVAAEPFVATAAAAGLGFLLGGGLPRGSIALLFETGTRVAAAWLGEEIRLRGAANDDSATEDDR